MKKFVGVGAVLGVVFSGTSAFAAVTASANFSQGDRVLIVEKINVRSTPGGSVKGSENTGALGRLVGGPVNMNGYTWWNVSYDNEVNGWSAEDFMQKPTVAIQTPGVSMAVPSNSTGNTSQVAAVGSLYNNLLQEIQQLLAEIAAIKQSQAAGSNQ